MNHLLLLSLSVLTLNSLALASLELPLETKKIILEEITADIFFEDEGFTREPSDLNDFIFTQVDEFKIQVTGKSYSSWDMKKIGYDCMVDVLTRGQIKSHKDIKVDCKLDGENWPND